MLNLYQIKFIPARGVAVQLCRHYGILSPALLAI